MNIKNLKIYSKNLLKENKIRLVALSLVGTSLFTLGGCSSSSKNNESSQNMSIIEMIDCLSQAEGLTTIDEDMKEPIIRTNGKTCDINILYDEYINALESYNAYDANTALYYMGLTSLKSLIASTYNISFNDINNLDVDMVSGDKVDDKGNEEHSYMYYYPITFDYNNVEYKILPEGKLAREVAYFVNRTYNHTLYFDNELNGGIPYAYDVFSSSLLFDGNNNNKQVFVNTGKNKIACDGSIEFNYNYDKLDVYSDYVANKDVEKAIVNETPDIINNDGLPVKNLIKY